MVAVSVADRVDAELVEAAARLVPQLSSSARPPGAAELTEIVNSTTTTLLVARQGAERGESSLEGHRVARSAGFACGPIVGMLTLAIFRIPTGLRAWVEDVVVDHPARGRGVASALTRAALELARDKGADTVDLTSRPSREAANRLYQRLGFQLRQTNVYRYDLRS